VVIDNRPGAGGTLGTALAARAPADGHHLLILNTLPHTSAAGLYGKLPYDPVKDFAGVGSIATTPYVFVANPRIPARTIGEFIALAKASPGKYQYGSAGTGSATHLVPELLKLVTGTDIQHVPYRGGGPAIVDLIGGHVDLVSDNLFSSIPNIKAGKIRALAVTSKKRSVIFPEIPTVAEAGYGDFEVVGQFGLVVPAATPRAAVERLNAALTKVVRTPEISQQILAQGGEPATSTPEEFDALMRSESAKWLRVIREARIKPE
jgi:tripartite-type tricarboxylate transporter receptor subunit TctC